VKQKPAASLSLDLDNLWSYMKTHGDPGWESFPSYLDIVVPRFLAMLDSLGLKITVFVVGQDAALAKNADALRAIAEAGHEIGNHSFNHEPWLHLYSRAQLQDDIAGAEAAIEQVTGARTRGFRGPGYSLSEDVLGVLKSRGYAYDCSTFPTFLGPLARAYYFMNAKLQAEKRSERKMLFGSLRDGLRPLAAYRWQLGDQSLLEIPVTTMPIIKTPFHFSYLHWLSTASENLADGYFSTALRMCAMQNLAPSLLLHPLDFLGCDDLSELAFFPGMSRSSTAKLKGIERWLTKLTSRFDVTPINVQAEGLGRQNLLLRRTDFRPGLAARGQQDR
jgi:hypothetical protein